MGNYICLVHNLLYDDVCPYCYPIVPGQYTGADDTAKRCPLCGELWHGVTAAGCVGHHYGVDHG